MRLRYMHTLNGKPAAYESGEQIYYAGTRSFPVRCVSSLKQIKRQQAASKEWRKKQNWTEALEYGWLVVCA